MFDNTVISDILIERPVNFSVGGRRFLLYQPTLGKMQLTARLVEIIGFAAESEKDAYMGALIVSHEHRDECLRIIAYATIPGDGCLDEGIVTARLGELHDLDDTEVATLLITVLTLDRSEEVIKATGMDHEAEELSRVVKVKKNGGSVSFGGRAVWGRLVDPVCERYGWTMHYVLWGISFANLRLLLADYVRTVYLSEEERKKANVSTDGIVLQMDGNANAAELEAFIKKQNWK